MSSNARDCPRSTDPGYVAATPLAVVGSKHLETEADAVVCVARPDRFSSVGQWYDTFDQTSDREVVDLLVRAGRGAAERSVLDTPEGV